VKLLLRLIVPWYFKLTIKNHCDTDVAFLILFDLCIGFGTVPVAVVHVATSVAVAVVADVVIVAATVAATIVIIVAF
jgi:hypothetical protein